MEEGAQYAQNELNPSLSTKGEMSTAEVDPENRESPKASIRAFHSHAMLRNSPTALDCWWNCEREREERGVRELPFGVKDPRVKWW